MELTTIRELFKNREEYLDKQVTVGFGNSKRIIQKQRGISG